LLGGFLFVRDTLREFGVKSSRDVLPDLKEMWASRYEHVLRRFYNLLAIGDQQERDLKNMERYAGLAIRTVRTVTPKVFLTFFLEGVTPGQWTFVSGRWTAN
jgi:hypothetical protein